MSKTICYKKEQEKVKKRKIQTSRLSFIQVDCEKTVITAMSYLPHYRNLSILIVVLMFIKSFCEESEIV